MIRHLATVLGPGHRGALCRYCAWLVAYAVLEGIAVAFLVPVLRSVFDGDTAGALRHLEVLVVATCVARYQQAMRGFGLAVATLTTLHDRLGDHLVRLPLGWFSSEKVGRVARSATTGTFTVTNVFAHRLTPVVIGVVTPATVVLAIPPRTMTAVVGASGAGKTTLVRLIARLFDVDAGSVRVGGTDVREMPVDMEPGPGHVLPHPGRGVRRTRPAVLRLDRRTSRHAATRGDWARRTGRYGHRPRPS
ncbi:ATP-binding cassette domain-containing protein [Streptomyces poonensis]|uniref:ABC transmembrane type-1 domain-containing protein n=1 Tax=Streptomyces poonensis TaxID=68255 RepID=A0A918PEI0_9ACTN|nr:ATP-binding cassette domain-containing protein [Streptomyces poonensis]GGZ01212.1 hypothetical protein GCM10010365_20240 [Streptomyces poonensis]GLJ90362.1 hypothetical protein GCM10017589_29650 [Streptomyces poonensis]